MVLYATFLRESSSRHARQKSLSADMPMDSLENSLALCNGVTDDGPVALDLFGRFRGWLIATLLLQHKTERSAAFSRDNRLSGSVLPALILLELFEASSPEPSASLETVVTLVRVLSDGD